MAEETTLFRTELPVDPEIEEMIQAGVFFGRKKSKTNPKMQEFVFGNRGGIEIIDLYATQGSLERALTFLKEKVHAGALTLFVGTQPMAQGVEALAKEFGFPFVTKRWLGGTLTNFKTLEERILHFKKLKTDLASGVLQKYTKKERVEFEKEIHKLSELFGGLEALEKLPEVLVVVDPVVHHTATREAKRARIPIVAFANTDADPDGIQYLVPGNTKSAKSIAWFLEKIRAAIQEGKLMPAAGETKEEKPDTAPHE